MPEVKEKEKDEGFTFFEALICEVSYPISLMALSLFQDVSLSAGHYFSKAKRVNN